MVDYIEREAAIREMYKEPSYYDPVNILTEVRDRIKAIPAADVRGVGKWIEREDMYWGWNIWECSACHEEFCIEEGTPKDNEYNYCPNCGAKMEVTNDTD